MQETPWVPRHSVLVVPSEPGDQCQQLRTWAAEGRGSGSVAKGKRWERGIELSQS